MSGEMLPGLAVLVEGWVIKKDATLAPQRMTSDDIEDLAKATVETLKERALGDVENGWGSLQALTSGWVVQRERGKVPTSLGKEDFRKFVMLALEGMAQQSSGASVLGDDVDEVSIEDEAPSLDAFRFAREHLQRCL
ncbi:MULTISPECIES: hypothetical protein [unclassified Gluconobacter]|uniref:hypothetical protein n=1 Tax=unclassified Gluconobacter TaxID=2644261 RepID=UPI001C0589A0|nr:MULTISPECIES: hypothetical protein [unclassified Gluconobacter]